MLTAIYVELTKRPNTPIHSLLLCVSSQQGANTDPIFTFVFIVTLLFFCFVFFCFVDGGFLGRLQLGPRCFLLPTGRVGERAGGDLGLTWSVLHWKKGSHELVKGTNIGELYAPEPSDRVGHGLVQQTAYYVKHC